MKEFWVKSNGTWITLHDDLTKDGELKGHWQKVVIIPIEYSAWLRLTGVELNKGEFKRIGIKQLKGGGVIPESRGGIHWIDTPKKKRVQRSKNGLPATMFC